VKATPMLLVAGLGLGRSASPPQPPVRPPLGSIEYELTFDRTTAASRSVRVAMRFTTAQAGPIELSLPAWTPGAYEISNFARQVSGFGAAQSAHALTWH